MLGVAFAVPFLCYFQKLELLVVKKFELIFAALYSIFMSLKSVSQILKILPQTGYVNIFVLRGAFFSRYVQLKSSLLTKKTSAVESETHFSR